MVQPRKEIVKRYNKNPIITGNMLPFNCRGVFNSTAVKHNGRYYMVLRAERIDLISLLWMAHSNDGYKWTIGKMIPLPDNEEYKSYGYNQYDPRLTKVDDIHYMTLCVHGDNARMGLFRSTDLEMFEWMGFITGDGFRNTVFFPEKINGLYTALERPNCSGDIWLTQSPDLKFWGNHKLIRKAGKHSIGVWGEGKIGPCGTPIKTDKGWLIIFHGVHRSPTFLYHTGVMLVDLEDPTKVIRVAREPILSPETLYERVGMVMNVIFASSHIVEDDGSVKLYYGAADTCQCVADTTVELLLEAALER